MEKLGCHEVGGILKEKEFTGKVLLASMQGILMFQEEKCQDEQAGQCHSVVQSGQSERWLCRGAAGPIILSDWGLKQQLQLIIDKEKVMSIWRSNSSCTLAIIGSNLAVTMSEELRVVLQKHQLEALRRSKGQ